MQAYRDYCLAMLLLFVRFGCGCTYVSRTNCSTDSILRVSLLLGIMVAAKRYSRSAKCQLRDFSKSLADLWQVVVLGEGSWVGLRYITCLL